MDTSSWIALASALAAWIATLYSIRSARIAKQSLKLMQEREKRQQPLLNPYLNKSFALSVDDEQFTLYGFSLAISNPTDIDNSLKRIEMTVKYKKAGQICNFTIDHDNKLSKYHDDVSSFSIPVEVPAHQTIVGWTLFKVDNAILSDSFIESYLLTITDTHDLKINLEPIIVCEIASHGSLEKEKNNAP